MTNSPLLSPARIALDDHEVHLWYEVLDPAHDDRRTAAAATLLSLDERQRAERFVFEEPRREYLAARCMIRSVLSRYHDTLPSEWRFRTNPYGRPEINGPAGAPRIRFNIGHAGGVVTCVLAARHDVGVDVERIGRRTSLDVARARFAASEIAALDALPEDERPRRFIEYWTLKEAYLKARGAGLSLPLDQFAFEFPRGRRPLVHFAPGFDDDTRAWQFDRLFVGAEHLVAIATRRGTHPDVSVVVRAFEGVDAADAPP